MKLSNQVISLEQAIKLKELGVNASAQFYYGTFWNDREMILESAGYFAARLSKFYEPDQSESDLRENLLPAYTLSELNAALPIGHNTYNVQDAVTELIEMLEDSILTPAEVNERINNA